MSKFAVTTDIRSITTLLIISEPSPAGQDHCCCNDVLQQ